MNPLHDHIARRAYEIWESEGRPHGRDVIHWIRAMWQIDPFPEYPDEDIVPHIPEIAQAIAEEAEYQAKMDAAYLADREAMQGEPAGYFNTVPVFNRTRHEMHKAGIFERRSFEHLDAQRGFAGAQGDTATVEALDRQIASLSDELRRHRDTVPMSDLPRPPTIAEFLQVRRALNMPRADAVNEVFEIWNETPRHELWAAVETEWPDDNLSLRLREIVADLRRDGYSRPQALIGFLYITTRTGLGMHYADARAMFDRLWTNITKRQSKKSRKA